MKWILSTVALALAACGTTEVTPQPDSGIAVLMLPSTARDAGNGKWCAPEAQPCLLDGFEYDQTGYCCLSRQTCKGRVDGGYGYCEY